jgi:hypothetical protein
MKVYKENDEAIPAIIVQDDAAPAPAGYTLLETNIPNVDQYYIYAYDYVRCTKEMWILFDAKAGDTEADKWANCTEEEKKPLARRHIINSQALRLEVYTQSQDEYNFFAHADSSVSCRRERIDASKIAIGYLLGVADRVDLFTELFTMIELFVNVNDTAIHTWMHSDSGFKAKSYYSAEIESKYTEIVEDGVY